MPHAHAVSGSLQVHVITVSTSRGPAEDTSGPLLREMASAAGHAIAGHAIVPDDPEAIAIELDRALAATNVNVVLLTGGTGVSARDCTAPVVKSRLEREIPGFGELFRQLSYAEIGAAAMLSGALGGIARGKVVFAMPGSSAACRLAMEKLILPELGHLAGELAKESPLPRKVGEGVRPVVRARLGVDPMPDLLTTPRAPPLAVPAPPSAPKGWATSESLPAPAVMEPPRRGIDVVPTGAGDPITPSAASTGEGPAPGWLAAVTALEGKLLPVGNLAIPEALAAIPAAMDVLNSANARMKLTAGDGRTWLCFGFPDLLRSSSKVIAVREGLPVAEIVALHRWPARVGLCTELGDALIPGVETDVAEISRERCGREPATTGHLFAVEGAAVWVQERRYVRKWDGKRLGPEENVGSAIGSLLLHWSQR